MGTININVLTNEMTQTKVYNGENDVTTLTIDYTGTAYATWNKWVGFKMPNGSDGVHELGTTASVTFKMTSAECVYPYVLILPFAKNPSDTTDQANFDEQRVTIEPWDNPILNNSSVQANLIDYIDSVLGEDNAVTKSGTGITNGAILDNSVNWETRTVTLSGTFEAYWRGVKIAELVDGWESPAFPDVEDDYFLYYDGEDYIWSTDPWLFDMLMITYVQYNTHNKALREHHGFMDVDSHAEFHDVIGTYKKSGGNFSGYTVGSNTAANRRPLISTTVVKDEDLQTTLPALSTASYCHRYLSGTGDRSFAVEQSEMLAVTGNIPNYNQFTGGSWVQTPMSNNEYAAIFVVAVPVTSDAQSQKYRYMWVQPQRVSSNLDVIKALTPLSLNHGDVTALVSEFVFIGKIIIKCTGSNWIIYETIEELSGTRVSQVGSPAGNYLSVVTTDTTLTGLGTVASPLSVISDKVYGTNLVTNGDFSNGTTGWAGSGSVTTSANTGINTANASTSIPFIRFLSAAPCIVGNVIYTRVRARVRDAVCLNLRIGIEGSTGGVTTTTILNTPAIDTWYNISCNVLLGASYSGVLKHYFYNAYADTATANGKVIEIQYAQSFDLTAIFGAGKEPTASQMDAMLANRYTNSWFDGTNVLFNVQDVYRLKADVAQEAWITPTLLNGWVEYSVGTSPQYYKDSFGVVHLRGAIKGGTVGTVAFGFPAGYRSPTFSRFAVPAGGAFGLVTIDNSTGNMNISAGSTSYIYFDGITYKV